MCTNITTRFRRAKLSCRGANATTNGNRLEPRAPIQYRHAVVDAKELARVFRILVAPSTSAAASTTLATDLTSSLAGGFAASLAGGFATTLATIGTLQGHRTTAGCGLAYTLQFRGGLTSSLTSSLTIDFAFDFAQPGTCLSVNLAGGCTTWVT